MSAGNFGSRRNVGSDRKKRTFASVPICRLILSDNMRGCSPTLRDIFPILLPLPTHPHLNGSRIAALTQVQSFNTVKF